VSHVFTSKGVSKSQISNNLNAVVALGVLTEGNTYTFKLTATDSSGSSSYSTVSLVMNEAPSSGSLVVSPKHGYALYTSFTFTATSWVDEDLPFTYIFGTTGVNSDDASLDTSLLSPFGDGRSDATYSGITLSSGSNITNFTVGCYVEVIDYYGAIGSDTRSIYVGSMVLTTEQLANISSSKASSAIESNDADAAKQIVYASTQEIQTTNDNRRRKLLGTSTSTELLRASLLSSLWNTYYITPVTVSDMASLLNVLVGIVDTPSELTTDVASGALNLLNKVWRK
jgi:hypothetical protein